MAQWWDAMWHLETSFSLSSFSLLPSCLPVAVTHGHASAVLRQAFLGLLHLSSSPYSSSRGSLSLSLSLSPLNSLFLSSRSRSLYPQRTGKPRTSISGHLTAARTGGDCSEGAYFAGGGSVRCGKQSLAEVVDRGRAMASWCWSAVSGHPHCHFKVPKSSFPPRCIGTLHSWRKYPDWWHVFSCKLVKLWQLILAKWSFILR